MDHLSKKPISELREMIRDEVRNDPDLLDVEKEGLKIILNKIEDFKKYRKAKR
jgi:hypothetical protein